MSSPTDTDLVLFDGVCNLCNGAVQFIIKRDRRSRFKFSSLQSDYSQKLMRKFGLNNNTLHSIILIRDDKLYQRSNAALEIARYLDGVWPAFYIFKIIPVFLRDPVYNLISRNRYRLFGKRDSCMIPLPELKDRFIE